MNHFMSAKEHADKMVAHMKEHPQLAKSHKELHMRIKEIVKSMRRASKMGR